MTISFVLTVAGAATAMLAALLLVLRSQKFNRLLLARARRIPGQSLYSTFFFLLPVAGASALCFGALSELGPQSTSATANAITDAGASDRKADALASLRAYADRIAAKREVTANLSLPGDQSTSGELADVATMVSQLAARLESEPNDVKGWKMLGWSYLNTGKTRDAIKAYETALRLAPDDTEMKSGLDAAKAADTAAPSAQNTTAVPQGPTADDFKTAEGMPEDQKATMIKGMVDRLANRLHVSPVDEDGWIRLMRARMVLGEKDAAKAALAKALETFSADASVKDRISASARELGIESN